MKVVDKILKDKLLIQMAMFVQIREQKFILIYELIRKTQVQLRKLPEALSTALKRNEVKYVTAIS